METYSCAGKGRSGEKAWFKASLGQVYCIEKVVQKWKWEGQLYTRIYTCSGDSCSCETTSHLNLCARHSFALYDGSEESISGEDAASGCKFGNTIMISSGTIVKVKINEILIFKKLGKSCTNFKMILFKSILLSDLP